MSSSQQMFPASSLLFFFLHPSLNVTKFIVDGCLERNPQNSLLTPWFFEEICRFWAEFGDFGMDSKKNSVILAVLCFA